MERRGLSAPDPDRGAAPTRLDPPGDELARRLFPSVATDVEWTLDRTRAALDDLHRPHLASPALHVGGTNGKGSVAACCASVLRAGGRRTGLYTSPHLVSFTERFRVDGRPVAERRLLEVAADVRPVVERRRLTFFEAVTVLAFELFRREGVEVGVFEVGLGGRLDATNVLQPEVTAVTNVALDHVEHLGGSLEEIAREKAGIVKEGVPLVTAERAGGALRVLRRTARRKGAPFHRVRRRDLRHLRSDRRGSRFRIATKRWGHLAVGCPLPGAHQALNAALAIRTLELLPSALRPSGTAVERGIASVEWPGRLQVVRDEDRTWIFDVAHNEAAVRSLVDALPDFELAEPVVGVVGLLSDKDPEVLLPLLAGVADVLILTVPPTAPAERRWEPRAVGEGATGTRVEVLPEFGPAMEAALRLSEGGSVIITGSHHTVGGALRYLGRGGRAAPGPTPP